MSETRAHYAVSGLTEGPKRESLLPFNSPEYQPPSWVEVRAVVRRLRMTGSELADFVGVQPRTVRKWLAPPDAANNSPIPYAAWRLVLVEAGIVPLAESLNLAERLRDSAESLALES